MRQLLILGLLTLVTFDLLGQGEVKGKIFINGQEFVNDMSEKKYFDFRPLTAKLSKEGKKYLDSFASYYKTNIGKADSLKTVVDPGQTLKEMKVVNNHIGLSRAWSAHNYLKEKYGIEIYKAVIYESYTACILTGKIQGKSKTKGK
ncbi:MAG: hypothetical protein ACK5R0_00665 [Bacteroidota bacterium]|jgi:hypothetical protein